MNIKRLILEEFRCLGAYNPEYLFDIHKNEFYIDDDGEVLLRVDGDEICYLEEGILMMKRNVDKWGNQFVAPDPEWEAHKAGIATRCRKEDFMHSIKQV